MATEALKVGKTYTTKGKRKVKLVEDHGSIVVRQFAGEEPQPMSRENFEALVFG